MIHICPNPFGTLSALRNECDDAGPDVLSSDEEVALSSEDEIAEEDKVGVVVSVAEAAVEIIEEDKVGVVVPVTAEAAAAETAEGDDVVLSSMSAEAAGAAPGSGDEICRAQTVKHPPFDPSGTYLIVSMVG